MMRRCLTVGCPNLTTGTRCATHSRRQARGYGPAHDRARRDLIAHLPLACAYCGDPITTPDTLAAAHIIDGNPTAGWQPAHRPCNEKAKQR